MPRAGRKQTPIEYLQRVISLIQRHALHSGDVEWEIVRHTCLKMADSAESPSDTYAAIKYVLQELKDGHSFLVPAKGVRMPSSRTQASSIQKKRRAPRRRAALLDSIGYIPIPTASAAKGKASLISYAQNIRRTIASFANAGADRWIFDLRANGGGSMWPMLAAVGPVLGPGTVGYFESTRLSVPWYYESGVAGIETARGRRKLCSVDDSIPDFGAEQPVAIIMDNATASSAEALAIAFKGRANTAYFGHPTAGLSTCNDELRLPDGAKLYLTVAVDADRNRNLYAAGLMPDFRVTELASKDVCLQSAVNWLSRTNIDESMRIR
jgi:C-terminal processing protease CtpA/Prc